MDLSEIARVWPLIKCNLRHGSSTVVVRGIEVGTLAFNLVSRVIELNQLTSIQILCSLLH